MPELPDIEVYLSALRERVAGLPIAAVRLTSPFVVRTAEPPIRGLAGERVRALRRLGKRLVFELSHDLYLVIHLMISGRLWWKAPGAAIPRRRGLAAIDFAAGSLLLTEASSKKRASIHLLRGAEALAAHDPGGLEVLECHRDAFAAALQRENHTLERALTDPRLLSGIGNAYSDEILHRARLSPVKWTRRLDTVEIDRLLAATREVLRHWWQRLDEERAGGFPEKVTAFREGMAVHGRFRKPCPVCQAPVQRIVRGKSETNYCPGCQTGGKVLADRALSKLLRGDWPRTLEQLAALGTGGADD